MMERIEGFPDEVVALRGRGEITAEDYVEVLIPALEEKLSRHRRVRLFCELGSDVTGFTASAAWQDAKVGMRHFASFYRIAVVTDIGWIRTAVNSMGFALPCDVKVFDMSQAHDAGEWIGEPLPTSELSFELLQDKGILVLRPRGELEAGDFERVAAAVDPFINETGGLRGLLIEAERFPWWEDFSAMVSHLRFVKDHHRKIRRIAIASNDRLVSMAPSLVRHFVSAELRHFAYDKKGDALQWLESD